MYLYRVQMYLYRVLTIYGSLISRQLGYLTRQFIGEVYLSIPIHLLAEVPTQSAGVPTQY